MFSNKMLVIRTEVHKLLGRIANRESPDQTASSEAVWSGPTLFVLAFSAEELSVRILRTSTIVGLNANITHSR